MNASTEYIKQLREKQNLEKERNAAKKQLFELQAEITKIRLELQKKQKQ